MSNPPSPPPNKLFSRSVEIGFFIVWSTITVLISYWMGQVCYSWMPPQATLESQKLDDLFSFLVSLGTVVFLGIFGMIGHSLVVCRAEKGDFSEGHPVRSNTQIEIIWTGIPILLVIWISIRGIHVYSQLDLRGLSTFSAAQPETALVQADSTPQPPVQTLVQTPAQTPAIVSNNTIEVRAKQWAWSFHYPDQDLTTDELHLLVNQPVRLVLTSADVLHGFYVPAFRMKQDIIPNREIVFSFSPLLEGKYRLRDSQFSGPFFPLMEADVYVDSPADYQQWRSQLASNPPPPIADLAAAERAHPPELWGKSWSVQPAPVTATAPSDETAANTTANKNKNNS